MTDTTPPLKLCLSMGEAAAALGLSRRGLYNLPGFPSILLGGRRVVRVADLERFLASQPLAVTNSASPERGEDEGTPRL